MGTAVLAKNRVGSSTHRPLHKPAQANQAAPNTAALRAVLAAHPANLLQLQRMSGNRAVAQSVQQLQRMVGNRAVSQLIQPRLTVGPAHDHFEQEADRVADQVMRAPAPANPQVQRTNQEDELQAKRIQRAQAPEEEELLQPKSTEQRAEDSFEAGPAVAERLNAGRGSGQPLDPDTRAFMEPRFGNDFSQVRIHTGADASQLNRALSAQAFTHGQDIYMGEGKYAPESNSGKQLLAHELTHTLQQSGGEQVQRKPDGNQGVIQRDLITQHEAAVINDILIDNPVLVRNDDKAKKELESLKRSFQRLATALSRNLSTEPDALVYLKSIVQGLQQLAALDQGGGYAKTGLEQYRKRKLEKAAWISLMLRKTYQHDPTRLLYDTKDTVIEEKDYGKKEVGNTTKATGEMVGTTDVESIGGKVLSHTLGGVMNLIAPVATTLMHGQLLYTQARKALANSTLSKVDNSANHSYNRPLELVRDGLANILNADYGKKVKPAVSQMTDRLEKFLKKRNAQSFEGAKGGQGFKSDGPSVLTPHLQIHFPRTVKKYQDWKKKKEDKKK